MLSYSWFPTRLNVQHMPSKAAEQQYAQVLFDSIHNGSYPESEDAVSADLPSTAIPHVLELLKQAREDVKVRSLLCP